VSLPSSSLAVDDAKPGAGVVKRATVRALPAPVTRDADNDALMMQVVSYYHDTLKQSPTRSRIQGAVSTIPN
jgi:hypothetical protein